MSAAAARRRKQLAARAAVSADEDVVALELKAILESNGDGDNTKSTMDEATAYGALQLAQSAVRRRVKEGKFADALDLAHSTCLSLLQRHGRVSVASQLLTLLTNVLRETHTVETDVWIERLVQLHRAHQTAMEQLEQQQLAIDTDDATTKEAQMLERNRLERLQRVWLLSAVQWSAELGPIRYGNNQLQALLGDQCWKLGRRLFLLAAEEEGKANGAVTPMDVEKNDGYDDDEEGLEQEALELHCDAVQHMALAEQPDAIVAWLSTLPAPTAEELQAGHTCAPALRDALLTRAILLFCAVENLRDATSLLRSYIQSVEERDAAALVASYTSKKGSGSGGGDSQQQAPSHVIFCSMLVRICQKDSRTGPLFQWLLRSFKRELDRFYKPQAVVSYTTKIGKVYFGIQPPPNMLSMMENMMGGGGMGGMGGGMNPAMMQAALAQLQGM